MEAMRLGTLPIVAPTGGLKDTVEVGLGVGPGPGARKVICFQVFSSSHNKYTLKKTKDVLEELLLKMFQPNKSRFYTLVIAMDNGPGLKI